MKPGREEHSKTQRLIEDEDRIVFLGDSITAAPEGYVKLVESMIGALAPDIRVTCINSGVSGNKIGDLLERIGEDAIAHDPDWISVSIGINDVWHGLNGTPIELFKERYEELVRRLMDQTVARLALLTTTVIGEDLENETNRRLIPYNDFIRETAARTGALLVPINEEFHKAISLRRRVSTNELYFTTDGVHMSHVGNCLMAVTLLRSWGFLL